METIGPNKVKLTMQVSPERFREGLQFSYKRNVGYFNIPGFRKGKAPRKMIEQSYGKEVFYEDAMNYVLPDAYDKAINDAGIEPVYRPEIETGDINETDGATFFAIVTTRPVAQVDNYYGLTYPKQDIEPSEDEIQAEIAKEQEKNARQVSIDGPAKNGDIVTINFTGYLNDEIFDGGTGKDHDLTLGSNQFIPGFEEQLVGKNVGDDVKVDVSFPENYHHEPLASKPVIFEVEILDIKEKILPELNDDFAQDVSEVDTFAEYRDEVKGKLRVQKEAAADNVKRGEILKQLVANTTVDIPEVMYTARVDEMFDDFERQIKMYGMDPAMYLEQMGMTEASMRQMWLPQAQTETKNTLALEAVAKKEGLTVSDEDIKKHIAEATQKEGEELDHLIANIPSSRKKDIDRQLECQKALDFLLEKSIAVDEVMPVVNAKALDAVDAPEAV